MGKLLEFERAREVREEPVSSDLLLVKRPQNIPNDRRKDTIYNRPQKPILDDVAYALELKRAFYSALGVPVPDNSSGALAFEPWLERARYERTMSDPTLNSEQKKQRTEQFEEEAAAQVLTNLRERNRTEQSSVRFVITGNKIRCALLPDENFEDILNRGLEYRSRAGSEELLREQEEVSLFTDRIQPRLIDPETEVNTRIISCSPPSEEEDTPYKKRFVDIWELKQDEGGERYIELVRFSTGLENRGYRNGLLKLNPCYFDEFESSGMPFATFVLAHETVLPPQEQIGSVQDLYGAFFERDDTTMKERLFQEGTHVFMPMIRRLVDKFCEATADWRTIANIYNAIINISDNFFEQRLKESDANLPQSSPNRTSVMNILISATAQSFLSSSVDEQIAHYSKQKVKSKMQDCGLSNGFNMSQIFENSIAAYGGSENIETSAVQGEFSIGCKDCGKSESDNHYHCPTPTCKKKYSDETNIAPGERTKKCKCGFEFGCASEGEEAGKVLEFKRPQERAKEISGDFAVAA